ncbi:MAG: hypothetical protein JO061_01960, partial [Acidobacteriaceae bacterium]|nr:hypothetical protein [Acidobacteriaceae bacterium]
VAGTLPLHAQTPYGGAGTRPVAVLLCQYSDKPNTYGFTPAAVLATWINNPVTFNGATADDSINGLVQDASNGTIGLQGTQAFGWYTLPNPLSSYATGSAAGTDCIAAAQQNGVNLAPFTYVAVYMNDALGDAQGESWTRPLATPSPTRLNALIVNQMGLTSPPLVVHELGHILSSGGQHTDSMSDPLGGAAWYGDNPMNPIPGVPLRSSSVSPEWDASRRELMGFIPAASHATFSGGTQTYNLSRLTQPLAGLPTAIDVPLPNGTKYVISARTLVGYDSYPIMLASAFIGNALSSEGVRIELFTSVDVDAHIEMSNPQGDPRSTDEVWLTGQTYTDSANGITISVVNFNPTGNPTAQITVSSGAKPDVFAVNSGGGAASPFVADAFYSGGTTFSTSSSIDTSGVTNPAPQLVYQTQRYGNFTYTFPNLTPGAAYKVRLHFAELFQNASGQRVFNVSINGTQVLTKFDIYATAGAQNKAVIDEFTANANSSGQIVIQYTSVVDNAASNGIEITQ